MTRLIGSHLTEILPFFYIKLCLFLMSNQFHFALWITCHFTFLEILWIPCFLQSFEIIILPISKFWPKALGPYCFHISWTFRQSAENWQHIPNVGSCSSAHFSSQSLFLAFSPCICFKKRIETVLILYRVLLAPQVLCVLSASVLLTAQFV